MSQICTSIEQSQKLMELGINIHTADMYWATDALPFMFFPLFPLDDIDSDWDYAQKNGMLPAWSLSALLELMPKELEDDLDLCYGAFDDNAEYQPLWTCSCRNHVDFGDTSVDAVFKVVCWLLENKKI